MDSGTMEDWIDDLRQERAQLLRDIENLKTENQRLREVIADYAKAGRRDR